MYCLEILPLNNSPSTELLQRVQNTYDNTLPFFCFLNLLQKSFHLWIWKVHQIHSQILFSMICLTLSFFFRMFTYVQIVWRFSQWTHTMTEVKHSINCHARRQRGTKGPSLYYVGKGVLRLFWTTHPPT